MIDYFLDEEGTIHVLVDNEEVCTESNCGHLSEQGLHDVAYELLKEYGYL